MKEKCPFKPDNEIVKGMSKVVSSSNGEYVDEDGVVVPSKNMVFIEENRDVSRFVKLYDFKIFTQLSKAGIALLCYAMKFAGYDGRVLLNQEYFTRRNKYKSSHTFYTAIQELENMDVIKPTQMKNLYWLNPNIACRGDRSRVFGMQNNQYSEMEE